DKLPASVRITALVKPQKPPKKQKRKLKAQGLWPPPLVSGRGAQARLLADSVLKFRFGVRSDTPIVGDWNGDGAWTPAVVRSRASWITVSRWKKLAAPKSRTLAVPAGAVPVAVPTPSNAAPGRCPTARPKAVRAGAKVVARFQPPVPLRRYNPFGDWVKVGDALRDEAGYLVSSDLSRRLAGASGDGYADILSTSPVTEYAVRRTANAAFTATLAVVTGAYGAQSQGASAATARAYSDWLVRSIACQYRSVSPGGWGRTWQSSLWAGVAGVAAWYSWDRLTAEQRGYVALMVTGEADAVAERRIEYWKDRNGDYTGDPGNTKAEEMSWDTFAPALAAAMFPTDPRATAWRTAVVQRGLASYATPADLTGTERVNGITLSSFLRGTNAKNDGTVVNHAVLNPDYMAAVGQLWAAGTMLRAGGSAVPKALLHNGALVYQSLATVRFPADTYPEAPEPRGPIYQPDGSIYFPGTVSWGRDRRGLWASLDGAAHVWGVGSQPDGLDAAQWLSHHIAGQRALQARFTDGHTYGDPSEDVYVGGREEYNGQQLALAYWTRAIVGSTTLRYDTGSYSATEPTEP
ncbi:MAG TPA: hypothetical protein VFN19_00505, partial [Candidatus Nanopelagicales bacterium]|nr:hypothetical protein [Candidatus Nanopelagicales bacterium]